jgi:RimJ/RimL family protein N-acetyltransferase
MQDCRIRHTAAGWPGLAFAQYQGQGLATEAARAVLALAGKAGIDQVLAITDLDNVASQRVATRLGMTDEGVTDRWFGLTARQYTKVISVPEL